MGKILTVIDSAYRASLEEQDDAGLWFSAAVAQAGAEITVLLTGNAVNYATNSHKMSSMKMGGGDISHPMDPSHDIKRMQDMGCTCFFVKEDAQDRGIEPSNLMTGVEAIARGGLADFVGGFDDIWHW